MAKSTLEKVIELLGHYIYLAQWEHEFLLDMYKRLDKAPATEKMVLKIDSIYRRIVGNKED